MSKKLSPSEAWEHVRALWPRATEIRNRGKIHCEIVYDVIGNTKRVAYPEIEIDWGDLDRYPPEPEQWRDAVWPDDWGRPCRSDSTIFVGDESIDMNDELLLVGFDPTRGDQSPWAVKCRNTYDIGWASTCQVRVTDEERTIRKSQIVDDADAIQKLQTKYHALYAAAQRVVEKHDAGSLSGKGDSAAIDDLKERLAVKS